MGCNSMESAGFVLVCVVMIVAILFCQCFKLQASSLSISYRGQLTEGRSLGGVCRDSPPLGCCKQSPRVLSLAGREAPDHKAWGVLCIYKFQSFICIHWSESFRNNIP